jgi:GNAT superfamily N-acetyltransferase
LRSGRFRELERFFFSQFWCGSPAITSRLVVSPSHRNTPLAARLGITVYQYGLEQGIHHDVIFVQPALVPMYLRMGYKNLSIKMLQHPQGVVVPMLLDVRNWDYLDSIGSICRRAPSFGKR